VVTCETVEDEKCEDVTEGYTTSKQCQKWPRQQCSLTKQTVTKFTTMTGCNKEPRELCAPAGCGFKEVNSRGRWSTFYNPDILLCCSNRPNSRLFVCSS